SLSLNRSMKQKNFGNGKARTKDTKHVLQSCSGASGHYTNAPIERTHGPLFSQVKEPLGFEFFTQLLKLELKSTHAHRLHAFNNNLQRTRARIKIHLAGDNHLKATFHIKRNFLKSALPHHRANLCILVFKTKVQMTTAMNAFKITNLTLNEYVGKLR